MMGGVKAHYDCIKAFSETDFTEELKKIDAPTLIVHRDDDKLLKNSTLKFYPGLPDGMCAADPEQIDADLLGFFKGSAVAGRGR